MSDIVLDDTEQVVVVCENLKVQGHDLLLDSPERRTPNGPSFRRALVHTESDGLTINFGNDYPGGVTIHGPTLTVTGGLQFTISHADEALAVLNGEARHPPDETVNLGDVIRTFRNQIAELQALVTKLVPGP